MSPRFSGQETFQWTGLQRTNVQVTQHRADPRQVKEKTNLHQEHKGEARTSRWDSSPCAAAGTAAQKPSAPARITEQNSNAQSRYTTESASSILASFGLSNEDLEELSRYPDDQLTPENMPLILREIRLRKMGRPLSTLHPRSRGKEAVGSAGGPAVKSKVIDYGHASKYGYTEDPLEVCVYNPEVPTEDPLDVRVYNPEVSSGESREDFPRDASMSLGVLQSGVTCNSTFPVEELMKQMGFQNESSSSRSFFAPEAAGKVSALCAAPAGLPVVKPVSQPAVPPVIPPMMPPIMPPLAQPMMPPVMPPLVQQPVAQHVMPALAQPPYSAELLAAVSQHERIPQEPVPSAAGPQSAPGAGPKPFPAQAEGPLKPPFALVKASWLPVFPQADAQKIKRLPTPSMMNDYYATSPRIFPHMCSLCNIECTHMKDWILHQNNPAHLESCRQLRHQYPDWNPEAHSSKRNGGERKENQTPRRRSSSASPGPRRCRGAAAGCGPRRSRSRSRSPGRPRAARPRSRSPRQPRRLSPRHRSRSPQRARNPLRSGPRPPRSSSNDWASRRNPRSPDKKATLEAVVKSLGPGFVAELNKHKPLQAAGPGSSGAGKSPPSHGPLGKGPGNVKKPLKTSGSPKTSRKDSSPPHGSSASKSKSPELDESPQSKEMEEDEEDLFTETSGPRPTPYNRLLREELLNCGTVLQISDLPDDGFSDQDIKKIVQPFGKVSDLLVLRSRNEAFLEMNYKEAVIAAVKYGETVPVLVNGRRVKISVAERAKLPLSQAKMNIKKIAQTIKKVTPSTKKDQNADTKTTKPVVTGKKEIPQKALVTGDSEINKPSNAAAPSKEHYPEDVKIPTEPEIEAEETNLLGPKEVAEGDTAAEFVTTVESQAKGLNKPAPVIEKLAQMPQMVEVESDQFNEALIDQDTAIVTAKNEESMESMSKELDDTCVVLISNLPEKGYSLEEISNLTKPFGGLKDVLMLSSHKKAYLEINRKSADSMVKFYTCFPMSLDGNQLCINVAPEYKTVKDEEAIFTAIIKASDPKVNPEAVHNKFVHLGNLPDDGYREVEVVCVGLRFGRVDHYVVLKNKNKAILQLETAKAAKSMYCFLNQNPYTMGEHTLTCALSPRAEPPEAAAVKKEVKKEEPGEGSPDLTKCPEGSGVVQSAAANPPVEPSVAKPEPGSSRDAQGARSALPAAPRGSAGAAGEAAAAPTEPAAPQLREDEAQETQPPTAGARQEGTLGNNAGAESSEGAGVPGAAGEMGAEAPGWLGAAAEPGAAGGAPAEAVPPGPAAAPPHRVPPGDAPRGNPVPGAVRTATEVPAAQSGAAMDKKLGPPAETAAERERDVAGAQLEREMEESALRGGAAAEQKPAKASTESGTEAERKLERSVAKAGAGFENAEKNVNESNEGSLVKAHQNKGPEPAKADDTHKAVPLSSALSAKESPAVNKTFLKAVVSLPDISKARGPVRSNEPALDKAEGQKASPKPESRGQAAAEKKAAPEEVCAPRPAGTRPALPDGASRASRSAPGDEKGGNGRSSSQQEKVLRAESRASSKQCQDRESRASSAKRDSSSNQISVGESARTSKSSSSSSAKQKEEEELFPFNLDEFVTVDEVIEEIESPVRTRRNPPRGKRREAPKNTSSEPSCKRRKGKSSAARAAESELSFVTLDEIGEEEDVATQLLGAAPPDALADPQGLVVVDEVTEEEEAAARDPRSLLTLDEIAEREDLACHTGAPGPAFEEADLKAEPLVTVDEIGEVEELPLNEPADLNVDDAARQKEDDKDCGDFVSSQVPDDPGALVTVDEIQEDNEDAPLVTLDEVNEDEDDFLADFNCLKEELNFVTVDEVGEEDDEEDSLTEENLNEDEDEDIVAVAGPEEEDIAAIAGTEEEDIVAVAGPEEMEILGDMSPEEEMTAISKSKGKESPAASRGEAENKLPAAGGQERGTEIPAAHKGEMEKRDIFHKAPEREAAKETASKQQREGDPLGSGERDPEPTRRRTDAADASRTRSAPKDLDFLVPKPGFFCQICSLFYADELSVKNHCKTRLHQQNMEKFMAKQKEGDNSSEERSLR
ncbi:zinc finger protein 638 [Nothoprocta perdicaria]|uniref:zinc finger protein 638 n=1 Tax=Nothoprocta perdicaria TaxID=30464 RepID=UPI000E1C39BF|nr:zinc finger protein 638 [Nothoprocta perdicaria]